MSRSLKIQQQECDQCIDILKYLFILDSIPKYTNTHFYSTSDTKKFYVTDSSFVTNELGITSFENLGSPANVNTYASLWESIVLNHLRAWYPRLNGENVFFYRDKIGNEIDFILTRRLMSIAIECKTSSNATMSAGTYAAMEKLDIPKEHGFIVTPFPSPKNKKTVTLPELHTKLEEIFNDPTQ
ncbi:MAG: DUF4143 domain-containing protein [Desulfovibrio sp.]|nr:DUF4143 domain-containing protein [Desulfovibrio sp.]